MGKRASVAPAKASAAKRQSTAASPAKRKAAASPAKPAEAPDPLNEVFRVLRKLCDAATADMLVEALPLALKAAEGAGARHDFQERMLDSAASELSKAVDRAQEAVTTIERRQAEFEEEKGQGESEKERVAAAIAERSKECDETKVVLTAKQAAVDEANGLLEAAKKHADAAEGDQKDMEKVRDEFLEGHAELFLPLKASEIPGNKYRERNKKLDLLVAKFKTIGVEESLLHAIQAALKIKADARGEFAQSAVTCAEDYYNKYIDAQKEKIEGFGSEISARAAAVSEKEAGVKVAQEACGESAQANIDAQNAWLEETNKDAELKAKIEAYEPTTMALRKDLLEAYAELAYLQKVNDDLVSQRSSMPPATEAAAEAEAAPAEPASVAEPAAEPAAAEAAAEEPAAAAP